MYFILPCREVKGTQVRNVFLLMDKWMDGCFTCFPFLLLQQAIYRTNTIDYNMATSTITATVYNHYAMV